MKLLVLSFLFILAAIVFPHTKLMGQVNHEDSAFYQAAVSNTINFYQQSTKDQPRYYNGRKYKPYRIEFVKGIPFFESDKFVKGNVVYEGGLYDNVELLYDQVTDILILKSGVAIELINERVSQFTINGHSFKRLVRDSAKILPGTGFYEILYTGKIEILKKEKKLIQENLSNSESVRGDIISKKYYYLKKNGHYYLIKNKGMLLDLLNDRKNEIQQFIKYYNLNFKKDTDNTLTKIAGYYDQLTR